MDSKIWSENIYTTKGKQRLITEVVIELWAMSSHLILKGPFNTELNDAIKKSLEKTRIGVT